MFHSHYKLCQPRLIFSQTLWSSSNLSWFSRIAGMRGIALPLIPFIYLCTASCFPRPGSPRSLPLQSVTTCQPGLPWYSRARAQHGTAACGSPPNPTTQAWFERRGRVCRDHHPAFLLTSLPQAIWPWKPDGFCSPCSRRGRPVAQPRYPRFLTWERRARQPLKSTSDASCDTALSDIYRGKVSSRKEQAPFNHGDWLPAAGWSESRAPQIQWKESHHFSLHRWKAQAWQHQGLPSSLPKGVADGPVAPRHQQQAARHIPTLPWSPRQDSQQVLPPHSPRTGVESPIPRKHRLGQVSSATSLGFYILRPLPCADQCFREKHFLISSTGGQQYHYWTQNKTCFFLSSKIWPYEKWPIKAFDNLPTKHNNSIFLIKQKT